MGEQRPAAVYVKAAIKGTFIGKSFEEGGEVTHLGWMEGSR